MGHKTSQFDPYKEKRDREAAAHIEWVKKQKMGLQASLERREANPIIKIFSHLKRRKPAPVTLPKLTLSKSGNKD